MIKSRDRILQVAVPSPLRRLFDYLPPDNNPDQDLVPGIRVRVSFGRRHVTGMIVATVKTTNLPAHKLKKITEVIDKRPVIDQQHLELLLWASDYYHHPVGEVIMNSLPGLLRQGKPDTLTGSVVWSVTPRGAALDPGTLSKSPRQKALLELLQLSPDGLDTEALKNRSIYSRPALKALREKGLLREDTRIQNAAIRQHPKTDYTPTDEQSDAIRVIMASLHRYNSFLLNGVTGSGKTEIYIRIIREVIKNKKQVLILLPEIGLTPQFVQRLEKGIHADIAVYHSSLTDRERLNTWLMARDNRIQVILGTRSAVWIPLQVPGLFIVDEEHDPSFKQQESFRYSARDLALVRARNSQCPVILGSATPSLESIHNQLRKDFQQIRLSRRVANASMPSVQLVDMKTTTLNGALSNSLHQLIAGTLEKKQQVLIFQNRRGYAPALMCHHCGWLAECERCNKYMTLHKQKQLLWCHHCDRQIRLPAQCPDCEHKELIEVGHGTERIEESLKDCFPTANIIRIDRDTTRRKGSMHLMYENILSGRADILIGTQMLAKGHHFPDVTLVAIVDIDSSLYSTDFRATERMGQLVTQVSGRAGRGEHPGCVVIQTHYPEHPLLQTLLRQGYMAFTSELLNERKAAGLPPYSFMALMRAEASHVQETEDFLHKARSLLSEGSRRELQIIGPIFAPMERKAGRYRMQLILQSGTRQLLNKILRSWLPQLEELKSARKVRWSVDVDPQDMM